MENKYVCIHGHFYQPPRENAWLERIEQQDSAYPYHDWNSRITAECYEPNAASRILAENNKIVEIVNNYSKISFNFGPTLLSWLEFRQPSVYNAILEADKLSQELYSGHGSAIAQAYNHMIMPLANERDKRTQVIWGIRDFESRFGRKPEGMWLPETAVNTETLEILADYGIDFTILAPNQASKFRKIGEKEWQDASGGKIDPRMAYRYNLPNGKYINLFFYEGPVSSALAFEGLLKNGKNFSDRILGILEDSPGKPQLAHIATDGESYGHHHRHGDMALSFCLHYIESNNLAKTTIYSEFLEKNPPRHEVKIHEDSAWSCAHGVERWRSNCGCKATGDPAITQEWREPLREALDWLRDKIAPLYEKEIGDLVYDPWRARDDYIKVILDRSDENSDAFFQEHTAKNITKEDRIKVKKLLEMQRHAMLMYTSCGWFFDDISGIETVQIMQYAARSIQIAKEISGEDLEPGFLSILGKAPSNFSKYGNGRQIYERFIQPGVIDLIRVGAHYAISSIFREYPKNTTISAYKTTSQAFYKEEAGVQKLAIGKTLVKSDITEEEKMLSYAVLYLGGHNIMGGVADFVSDENFAKMHQEIKEAFVKSDIIQIIHLLDNHFGMHNYSFWHLFRDEQRHIINQILHEKLATVKGTFRELFNTNYGLMKVLVDLDLPMPNALSVPGEFVLNSDFSEQVENGKINIKELKKTIEEINNFKLNVDKTTIGFKLSQQIHQLMEKVKDDINDIEAIETLDELLTVLEDLEIDLDLWKAQNTYYLLWKNKHHEIASKSTSPDKNANKWAKHFYSIGKDLNVHVENDEIK